MKEVNEKLNVWVLLTIAIITVALFQRDALFTLEDFSIDAPDVVGIKMGYERALEYGTARWWAGGWIHELIAYYRPLSSYGHMAQIWVLYHVGYTPLIILTMLTYAALCVIVGLFSFTLTRRPIIAYLACGLMGAYWADGKTYWLAFYPFLDNIMTVGAQILALSAFIQFLRTYNHRWLVATWFLFVCAGLCKEQGWATSVMLLPLACFIPDNVKTKILAGAHVFMMCATSGIMYRYSKSVTGNWSQISDEVAGFWTPWLHNWWWWPLVLAAAVYALVVMKRKNEVAPAIAFLCALVACIPLMIVNLDIMNFRFIFVFPFIAVFLASLLESFLLTTANTKLSDLDRPPCTIKRCSQHVESLSDGSRWGVPVPSIGRYVGFGIRRSLRVKQSTDE